MHTGTANPTTSRKYSSILQTQPERIKQQLLPENNKKKTANSPNKSTPKHQTLIKGQNNIVIVINMTPISTHISTRIKYEKRSTQI